MPHRDRTPGPSPVSDWQLRMARERVSDLIFLVGQEIARYLENHFIDVIILMISATSSVHISNLSIAMASMVVTDAAIAR